MSYLNALKNLRRQVETDVVEPQNSVAAPSTRGLVTRSYTPEPRQPQYEPLTFARNTLRVITDARRRFQESLADSAQEAEQSERQTQQNNRQMAQMFARRGGPEEAAPTRESPPREEAPAVAPTTDRPSGRTDVTPQRGEVNFSDRRTAASQVYQAFLGADFSPAQARALTAEINRENSMRPDLLFGSHSDPHNRATNVGMLSWQGTRATRLMDFLRERGQLDERGQIRRTPEALQAQAQYLRWEMENDSSYARTRREFLGNPEIDYDTAHTVLGDNFIRWRRTDPRYRNSGYGRIDEGYRLLGDA
jgi:hypothetical protein